VTLSFLGNIVEGAFLPATTKVDISGGPSPISIGNLSIPGAMPLVPPGVPVPCVGSTQAFTANGTFLTLGASTT
jgi:hypothetical protein